jgi:hypothetical protein
VAAIGAIPRFHEGYDVDEGVIQPRILDEPYEDWIGLFTYFWTSTKSGILVYLYSREFMSE